MKFKLFIFFVLVSYSGLAKDDFQYISPRFQKLDLKDGLTNLNVSSIVQDNLGYIWIATARGLNRFDGTSFKHYFFNEDENSLYHNWVTKLYKNCDGQIFCSTRYGLNLIDPDKDKMYRISSSNEFFIDFVEFKNITYGISNLNGLCIYNKTDKSFSKLPTTDHDRIFNHLVSDKESGIWAKSVENLTTVAPLSAPSLQTKNTTINTPVLVNYNPDSNTFKKFVIPKSSESSYDSPMIKIDSILLITGKNFCAFNLHTLQFIPFPAKWNNFSEIKEFEIMFVKQIGKQILWIGTRTKGLFIFNLDKNTLVNLNKTNSDLNANWATCVFKDKDKNVWLGTFDHGVYIAFKDRSNINFDNTLNELTSDKFISCITSDLKQNYIIGTRYDGFYIYNNQNKNYKHFYVGNSFLTSNHIRTIFIDSKNKLWIASEKVLHITDFKVHKSIDFYLPKPNFGMVSFCEQAGKVIASSDAQGFFIFDIDGTFLKQELKLGSNISQIIPVNNEELIVASFDNGIFSYNVKSGAYKNIYKSKKSERYNLNQPITIYLDTDSILWIGNYVSGLYKLNLKSNSFKSYSMEDGLPNNDIVGIVQDSYGKLWLSTSYGLSRFDKKQEFVNYFYNEGLENIQFHAKAAHLDSKGIIYFGGNYGLSYFDPIVLSEAEKKSAPKIILESLTVQNRLILPDDQTKILSTILNKTSKIRLKHNQNTITIEYHAFDFVAADEIRYAYKLEGLDEQWNNGCTTNFPFV